MNPLFIDLITFGAAKAARTIASGLSGVEPKPVYLGEGKIQSYCIKMNNGDCIQLKHYGLRNAFPLKCQVWVYKSNICVEVYNNKKQPTTRIIEPIQDESFGNLAGNNADMPKFIWDEHNLYHILVEHKERDLSVSEVESVFDDPNCIVEEAGNDKTGEKQFFCIGLGNKNIVRFVLYNVRNGKIRPFSVRTAKRNKERKLYYEQLG